MNKRLEALKKWQKKKGASDQWYIAVNGVVDNNLKTLADIEVFVEHGETAISALHADQAVYTDPQWIELINQQQDVSSKICKQSKQKKEAFSLSNWLSAFLKDAIFGQNSAKQGLLLLCIIPVIIGSIWVYHTSLKSPFQSAVKNVESKYEDFNKTPEQPSFRKDQIIRVRKVTSGGDLGFIGGRRGPRPFTTIKKTRYEVTYIDDDGIERTVTRGYDPTR